MTLFINICERQKYVENKCKERKAKAKTKHKKNCIICCFHLQVNKKCEMFFKTNIRCWRPFEIAFVLLSYVFISRYIFFVHFD